MGQKVNPESFRLGAKLQNSWDCFSFVGRSSAKGVLSQAMQIRSFVFKTFSAAKVAKVSIRLSNSRVFVEIFCKKPGVIIGSSGTAIEKAKKFIEKIVSADGKMEVVINVHEVKIADTNASLVAQSIASAIEKRGSFRKIMKKAVQLAMRSGAKGVKIACSGRLAGADIARTEKYMEGTVPLHTLRAKIDYAFAEAKISYGIIGIKVWIHTDNKILTKI